MQCGLNQCQTPFDTLPLARSPSSGVQVLRTAQTAFFVAVVICKAATVVTAKTRLVSVFQHGVRNNR